ncbi:ABC transporter ATP-binding protein, partial [Pedobacter sp. HMWF019]|uniref:ABC transporter ATP-binding protein n=1 Tax=Pedobacter sp. HMWF019 TaxID=2056856 RepID=UPI000D45F1C1
SIEHLEAFSQELAAGRELYMGKEIGRFNREITFNGVSFGYQKHTVLKDISFSIYKNETVALVGESGSGKSTLVNMISGLLNAGTGQICIDGADLLDMDVRDFRSRIGYITQEPVIFNDTVYNNVTLWSVRTAENLSRFEDACKRAAIWDFVLSAPNGLNTELGNAGINLSGGQRQRISIARELYKEVDLLILDEATSALDSSTEQLIQKSMEALKGKVTLIVIAHRLSTIKQADRIVLLKKGEIMQIDGFSELVASNGAFKTMVEQQVI